jgi:hypothetical protein
MLAQKVTGSTSLAHFALALEKRSAAKDVRLAKGKIPQGA